MPVVTASTERASSPSPLVPSRHVVLHADEVLDRVEGGQPPAAQQKLPHQRRGRARDV
jgi:hypothetical protein